jgi:hypothetical protein
MSAEQDIRLADAEQNALAAVETEWQRRATGLRPWSTAHYLAHIQAVHVRFAHMRRYQTKTEVAA